MRSVVLAYAELLACAVDLDPAGAAMGVVCSRVFFDCFRLEKVSVVDGVSDEWLVVEAKLELCIDEYVLVVQEDRVSVYLGRELVASTPLRRGGSFLSALLDLFKGEDVVVGDFEE
ncbi:hypothetical protein [Thermofilum pendens]|uniref:Uncharacterized protein n=1 Tax=Thermofilum pendens (strain DSM 2475 / Hrk 5) TaxID=368408 RepID=A1RZQ1_THEPD|nr:hypothetical protein [Thermofilum pendens]ABL78681.1 hypothetical protein Tpen_1283 [Thermofilum pendens Hrk 5]